MNELKKYRDIFMPMRLQPPHIGHISLIKEASLKANRVLVLICDCSEINSKNPFYGIEREKMLRKSLDDISIDNVKIFQMPSAIEKKDWFEFVKDLNLIDEETVVVSGNPFIIENFPKEFGTRLILKPEDLIENKLVDIDATRLREMIKRENLDWKKFAASGTIFYFDKFKLQKRLLEI